jgi:hypothetical protein
VVTGSIVDDTGNGFFMTNVVKPFARRTFLADVCADMRRAGTSCARPISTGRSCGRRG